MHYTTLTDPRFKLLLVISLLASIQIYISLCIAEKRDRDKHNSDYTKRNIKSSKKDKKKEK